MTSDANTIVIPLELPETRGSVEERSHNTSSILKENFGGLTLSQNEYSLLTKELDLP